MKHSVLLSALISLATFVVAAPTPGAVSKRSSKRENSGISFQRDLLEENERREELDTDAVHYYGYEELDQERELKTGLEEYNRFKKRELQTGLEEYNRFKKRELQTGLEEYNRSKKRELQTGLEEYNRFKKRELQTGLEEYNRFKKRELHTRLNDYDRLD